MVSKLAMRALRVMKFVKAMRKKLKVLPAMTEAAVWQEMEDVVAAEDAKSAHVARLLHYTSEDFRDVRHRVWWFSLTYTEQSEILGELTDMRAAEDRAATERERERKRMHLAEERDRLSRAADRMRLRLAVDRDRLSRAADRMRLRLSVDY